MSPNAERNLQRKIANALPRGAVITSTEKFKMGKVSGTGTVKKTNRIRIYYNYQGKELTTVISGMPRGIPMDERKR